MKTKGAVLTHETLLRAVWSSEMVGELNTLRVTVARVRPQVLGARPRGVGHHEFLTRRLHDARSDRHVIFLTFFAEPVALVTFLSVRIIIKKAVVFSFSPEARHRFKEKQSPR
jgi:hypothetical protein